VSATLTIQLDADVLKSAELEAHARRTTVSDIVSQQLKVMAQNWHDSQMGKTPIADSLRGTISLPANFDERATLAEELLKKHAD
jgi:hypothetical protein